MILGNGLLQASGWPQASDWLVKDEFTDTVAAGSVNGTAATPGPGTRTVVDGSSYTSVANGVLDMDSGANSISTGVTSVAYDSVSRTAGLAVLSRLAVKFSARVTFGLHTSAAIGGNVPAVDLWPNTDFSGTRRTSGNSSLTPVATEYQLAQYAIVAKSAGALFLVKNGSSWVLLWATSSGSDATLYPVLQSVGTGQLDAQMDYLRVIALPAPFDSDDGLATDVLSGSVAAGTTFSHTADMLLEFTVTTLPSGASIRFNFRTQDANNYWQVYCASNGDFVLLEFVGGGNTVRAGAFGIMASGHRVVVIAEGTTIKGYSNDVLRWTYSSATNFATATAGSVASLGIGGAVSNVKTWPRTLSGTAASILNKASA